MRKNLRISAIFMVTIMTLVLVSCQKKETITTVRLNEVVHSIFYAPQYVAIEKGLFKEQGLEIDLSVGQGADSRVTQWKQIIIVNV